MALEQIGLEAVLQDANFQEGVKRYVASLAKTETETTKTASAMSQLGDVASGALSVGISAIGIAAGVAIAALAGLSAAVVGAVALSKTGLDASLAWGEQLDKLADQFGTSGEEGSAWAYAMNRVGISVDEGAAGLNYFTRQLDDWGKNAGKADAVATPFEASLKKLGLSAVTSTGALKDFDTLMPEIMDAFSKLPGGIESSAIAMDLFGARGGSKFLDFLRQGSAGLEDAGEKARQYGLTMSTETVDALEQFGFMQNEIGMAATGVWNQIGIAVLPLAEEILPILLQALGDISNIIGTIDLSGFADQFGQVAQDALTWGENIIINFANGLQSGLGYVADILTELGDELAYWLSPGSPPKIAPDLDKWGADAMTVYMGGWAQGDFSVFDDISSEIEKQLISMVNLGKMQEVDLIPTLLGSRESVAKAMNELRETGNISQATFDTVVASAGPAGESVRSLLQSYMDLQKASNELTQAQNKLSAADEEVAIAQAGVRGAEGDKVASAIAQAALRAAVAKREQAKLDIATAKVSQSTAQDKIAMEKAVMTEEQKNSSLMKQQVDLLNRLALAAEKKSESEETAAKRAATESGKAIDTAQQEADAKAKAELNYRLSISSTSEKIAILRGELAKTTKGSVEYYQILTQIAQLEDKATTAAGKVASKVSLLRPVAKTPGQAKEIVPTKESPLAGILGSLSQVQASSAQLFKPALDWWKEKGPTIIADAGSIFETIGQTARDVFTSEQMKAAQDAFARYLSTGPIGDFVNWIKQKFPDVSKTFADVSTTINDVIKTIGNIVKDVLLPAFTDYYNWLSEKWPEVKDILGEVGKLIQPSIDRISEGIKTLTKFWKEHGTDIMKWVKLAYTGIKRSIDTMLTIIFAVVKAALQILNGNWKGAWETIQKAGKKVWENISKQFDDFLNTLYKTILLPAMEKIRKFFEDKWNEIKKKTEDIWNDIKAKAKEIWKQIGEAIKDAIEDIDKKVKDGLEKVRKTALAIWEFMTKDTEEKWALILAKIIEIVGRIKDRVEEELNKLKDKMSEIWQGIVDAARAKWEELVTTITNFIRDLPTRVNEAIASLIEIGRRIVKAISDGIVDAWEKAGGIVDTLKEKLSNLWNYVWSGKLGEDLAKIGEAILTAIGDGLKAAWDGVTGLWQTLWRLLSDLWQNLINLDLKSVGEGIINKIIEGIQFYWDTFVNWLKEAIVGIFREASVPIVLRLAAKDIKNSGAMMADLLRTGFENRMGEIGSAFLPRMSSLSGVGTSPMTNTYSTVNNSSLTQNLYVSTAAPVSTVVQDFGMMRALANA